MKNNSLAQPVVGGDNVGELNVYIYQNGKPIDVNELIIHNRELAEENKILSMRLEWAMSQIGIKDTLLKELLYE